MKHPQHFVNLEDPQVLKEVIDGLYNMYNVDWIDTNTLKGNTLTHRRKTLRGLIRTFFATTLCDRLDNPDYDGRLAVAMANASYGEQFCQTLNSNMQNNWKETFEFGCTMSGDRCTIACAHKRCEPEYSGSAHAHNCVGWQFE